MCDINSNGFKRVHARKNKEEEKDNRRTKNRKRDETSCDTSISEGLELRWMYLTPYWGLKISSWISSGF
jgi:hypothetical protein